MMNLTNENMDIGKYPQFLDGEGWWGLIDERWKNEVKQLLTTKFPDMTVAEWNEDGTFWLTQKRMAELLGVDVLAVGYQVVWRARAPAFRVAGEGARVPPMGHEHACTADSRVLCNSTKRAALGHIWHNATGKRTTLKKRADGSYRLRLNGVESVCITYRIIH